MKRYKIGVIGCGGAGTFFLKGWDAWQDRVEITALCDVAESQIARQRTAFPKLCEGAASFEDYRVMLAEAPLDIVCISSPSAEHLEQTEAALTAGKHVFVEKPTGYNLEEARRFAYLARKFPQQKVAVAYSLRYLKAFAAMKMLIERGELGEIITGEISYSHPHYGSHRGRSIEAGDEKNANSTPLATAPAKHESFKVGGYEDAGGNYIPSSKLVKSTHPWDLARYFLGEVRECFATANGGSGAQMGILWMESGALCHVLAGSMRVPDVGGNQHQFAQFHGTGGSAWLMRDLYEPYEYHAFYRTQGDIQEFKYPLDIEDSSHGVVLRSNNFLEALENRAALICDLADGVRTTELLHALWLSGRTYTRVPVTPGNSTG